MSSEEIEAKVNNCDITICVVGLGYVGLCIASVLADVGYRVIGADVDSTIIQTVKRGKAPFYESELDQLVKKVVASGRLTPTSNVVEATRKSDVVIIAVGTPPDKSGKIRFEYLKAACKKVGEGLTKGKLVILKSTVPPGTTNTIVRSILEKTSNLKATKDFLLVYCPERLSEGKAIQELRILPEIIGGIDKKASEVAAAIFAKLGVQTILVSKPEVAELVKLADNAWIDLSIAYANELAKICEKTGVDVQEVISAANTLPEARNWHMLRPGLAGGSCLTKDPLFLVAYAKERGAEIHLPAVARRINARMYLHIAGLIEDALHEMGKALRGSRVSILGLAFKGDVSDLRGSQALSLARKLAKEGATVKAYDPFVAKAPRGISMESDLISAVKNSDCIVVATEHTAFKQINLEEITKYVNKPCAIVDARAIINPLIALKLGFIWRGLGRPIGAFRGG
jgi:UDP-N-acetyl-D-mannosaminuronic acid dehydrogenase